jgi:hypothetical protein
MILLVWEHSIQLLLVWEHSIQLQPTYPIRPGAPSLWSIAALQAVGSISNPMLQAIPPSAPAHAAGDSA